MYLVDYVLLFTILKGFAWHIFYKSIILNDLYGVDIMNEAVEIATLRLFPEPPYFWNEKDGKKMSTQVKTLKFKTKDKSFSISTALNSNLLYWWFVMFSDCRHLTSREIDHFRYKVPEGYFSVLADVFTRLNKDYESKKHRKETYYKTNGKVMYDEYYPKYSKPIIDEIDSIIAPFYGFTYAELDFIINYDIKHRMGKELESQGGDA